MAGQDCPYLGLENAAQAAGWSGGSTLTGTARPLCKGRRRASRGLCLSVRFVPLLASSAWPQRLRSRAIRREFHGRRLARRRGVHRRPIPDRKRAVRSDAAARHLLPGRHPYERIRKRRRSSSSITDRAFISVSSRRARSKPATRSCKLLAGPERLTSPRSMRCCICRSPTGAARTGAAHPGVKRGLALVFETSLERERTRRPGRRQSRAPRPRLRRRRHGPGFRTLRVADKRRESSNVTSLVLEPSDGRPLVAAMPGQFIVLRLKPAPDAPALLRSYSLSGEPSEQRWRISVKREPERRRRGLCPGGLQVGDVIDASAPRGAFTLKPGTALWSC